jgi:transcriptional regulator with XRE-family HTH domain
LNRIKELRERKNLTQQELADNLGISKRTLGYWEKGEVQIKPDKAQALADYFGVSDSYLHGYGYKKRETKPVEKLESVYVEFMENINTISDIDLEDLKGFSNRLYEMAIAEKTRRYHVDTLSDKIQEEKNKKSRAIS